MHQLEVGVVVGIDRASDTQRFFVTEKGVVLVTPDMLRGLRATLR